MKGTKKWKRLIALAISTAMLLPQTAAYAEEGQPVEQMEPMEEVESADYLEAAATSAQADENGFVIEDGVLKKYTGTAAEVAIPEGVTGIGNYAFDGCSGLTSISIPNGVVSIGYWAFKGCSGLTGISIPSSVASIGGGAFSGCSGLENIKVEEGNEKYDSRGDCNAIIETERNVLLRGCKNTVIPSDVTRIAGNAFDWCSGLTNISIPSSVTSIASYAFYRCSGLTSISIPSSVTSIEESSFYGCSGLRDITLPEGVTDIKGSAFAGCSSLTSIEIPNGVASIGWSAFSDCSSLTSIEIPNGVASIEDYTFKGCSGLTSISIPSSVASIGSGAFFDCSSLTSIEIPNGVASIGGGAFSGCSGLTGISIPSSVASIGGGAFSGCSGLTGISIPSSVASIGGGAFSGCSGLESIKVEKGNEKYDSREDCNAIIEIESNMLLCGCKNTVIPSDVTSIGYSAFNGCSGLTGISIPSSVTSIDDNTFAGCSGLRDITLPEGVTDIGECAFAGCSSLTKFTIPDGVPFIRNYTFSDCSSLTSVKIPGSVTDIAESAFNGCSSLTSVEIPSSVTYIGDAAFNGCSSLTSVEIPSSVTGIAWDAFEGCDRLTIYGEEGSYAQTYATENNILFQVQALATAKALSDCQITLDNTTVTYNGTAQTPAITVKDGNNVLKPGTDYTVTYSNNTNAGTAQAAVTGKGGYTGTVTKEFTIACADIARCTVSLNADSCVYNGTAQTPAITVKDGNNVLKPGTDYTVTYSNNTNAGTAQAAVTGKGNYTGTATKAFTIQKAGQKLSYTKSYTKAYGSKPFKLDAKLESGSGKLTYASSNKKVATVKDGKVTVTGTGVAAITVKAAGTANYNEASVKVTVKVTPAKQTVKSVKAVKGRKLTVKWKKDTRATGCQIQYSTDKKFKKGVKTVTVSKSTTTAKTITKLKQGKKYYVRVRSYKSVKVNGKTQKLYGTWSSAKKSGTIKK